MKTNTNLANSFTPTKPKSAKDFQSDKLQHNGAQYSPCGQYLIAGGYEGTVHRWKIAGSEPVRVPSVNGHNGWVQALEFSTTNNVIYTGDSWGRLRAWDYTAEQPVASWDIESAHDGWLRCISVSSDGKLLATCGRDRLVRLWNAADGKLIQEFAGHQHDVHVVRFHPDGQQLVSGDQYGKIQHWRIGRDKPVRELDARVLYTEHRLQEVGGVRALTFDETGKFLLAGGTKPKNGGNVQGVPTLLTFQWSDGHAHQTVFGASSEVYIFDLHYDRRGFVIVGISGSPGTGKFCLWKIGSDEPFFSQKMANCHAVSMHPDGHTLALTSINARNQGNGRVKGDTEGEYPGNWSPVSFWTFPA